MNAIKLKIQIDSFRQNLKIIVSNNTKTFMVNKIIWTHIFYKRSFDPKGH